MGEARRKRAAGEAPSASATREPRRTLPAVTTTVAIRYKGASLRAEIDPADVDGMLADVDRIPAAAKDRGGAMTWVLNAVRRNAHLSDDGEHVVATVLWLLCRHPVTGALALTYARDGDVVLAYDVTENLPDLRATRGVNNWRAIMGPRDGAAALLPWLPPADFPTAGSA